MKAAQALENTPAWQQSRGATRTAARSTAWRPSPPMKPAGLPAANSPASGGRRA